MPNNAVNADSQNHDEVIFLKNEKTLSSQFLFFRMDEPMFLIEVPAALNEERLMGAEDTAVLKNDLALPDREPVGLLRSLFLGAAGGSLRPLCVKMSD